MLSDKELKKKYMKIFSENPEKYYPTSFFASIGFVRKKCTKCKKFFWTGEPKRGVCGDSACTGSFSFIGNTPARKKLSYAGVWKSFSSFLKKDFGYTPIKRYPVVARWREDLAFVEASIDDFIPYVIQGEVTPPANPLVIPQFCLRFNDIINVGVTGSHYTGFVMIGQHRFERPGDYRMADYLSQLFSWFEKELGLKREHITFHEEVWAGSGNFGPCIELFSGGLELANQVYMQFRQTRDEYRDLNLKVLDMGMGCERVAWFSHGATNSYETTFPTVVKKLKQAFKVELDAKLMSKFMLYSGSLNADETEDLEAAWRAVAKKLGVDVKVLKEQVLPLQAVYSIADHLRSLLLALSDGALPSNSGGGYNLRVILRRSLDLTERHGWKLDFSKICDWHVQDLKELFPEVSKNLGDVKKILEIEKEKYFLSKKRAKEYTQRLKKKISTSDLIELYESHGISPEMVKAEGIKVSVPEDFYAILAEKNRREQERAKKDSAKFKETPFANIVHVGPEAEDSVTIRTEELDLRAIKKTEVLYYSDYSKTKFEAEVVKVVNLKSIKLSKNYQSIILDKTYFYPRSGGQDHDEGFLNGNKILDVFKEGNKIVHVVEGNKIKEKDKVHGEIDWERRKQLAQHHSAVHIINGAARKVLGNHVWQAGAEKTLDKARLDISHHSALSKKEVREIEELANKMVARDVKIESIVMLKHEAEKKHGFRLYQGGVVPGGELRVVKIGDFDIEACGGTHLKRTGEAGLILITGTTKIQDGVVRLELKAGRAAEIYVKELLDIANESLKLLGCSVSELAKKCNELFLAWKKKKRKGKEYLFEKGKFKKAGARNYKEIRKIQKALAGAQEALRVQKEHVPRTIKRFLKDLGME